MHIPSALHSIRSFIRFIRYSKNEYSLHSPFVFDLYTKALKKPFYNPKYHLIERARKSLLTNNTLIPFDTLGVPSRANASASQKVSSIAKNSLKEKKNAIRIHQLIKYMNYEHIIELGTSFGITTSYLALKTRTQSTPEVTTFEGNAFIANIARSHFEKLNSKNITMIQGNIDLTLPEHFKSVEKIDCALIDANHAYEPTLRYFNLLKSKMDEHSCIIIDDIYWSKEMTKAWNEITRLSEVTVSIDLFHFGVVFFRKEQVKEHFMLRL